MVTTRWILALAACTALVASLGCSSSSSGNDTTTADVPGTDMGTDTAMPDTAMPDTTMPDTTMPDTTMPDTTMPDTTVMDTPADVPVEMVTFTGIIEDFQTKDPVVGATVDVLDTVTGAPTGLSTTSQDGGAVTFDLPKGTMVAFKVSGSDSTDTYQFNIDPASVDKVLWLVSNTTYTLAPALAGLTVDASKGVVAGGLYFFNDKNANGIIDDGEEEPVGCATIETTPAGEYRYFNPTTGLPAALATAPTTSKDLSYFLAANIPAGTTMVKGMINGTEVGSTQIVTVAGAICISSIYVTTDTNPTPADCTY